LVLTLAGLAAAAAPPQKGPAAPSASTAQPAAAAAPAPDGGPQTIGQVITQIVGTESALMARLKKYRPLVETYIQNMTLTGDEQVIAVPKSDEYFLGKLDLTAGLTTDSMLPASRGIRGKLRGTLTGALPMRMRYMLDSFAAMALVDRDSFDANRYEFSFAGREFLGETRCAVFEVRPKGRKKSGFIGKIWAEDRGFTIVRFNGANGTLPGALGQEDFHFDSWRVQMGPGVWLPAYIYSEESNLGYGLIKARKARFKAQTRIWGYDAKKVTKDDEFTAIMIDDPNARDRSDVDNGLSPLRNQRRWERHAEDNVLGRLEKARLVAAPSDVDRILETVANNLVVTNNVDIEPPARVRVVLTSPLETFAIGHTIMLSRGLIDVLPDEGTLAAMLAHELAHMVLGHMPVDTKYSFADRMMIDDTELLESFRFRRNPAEEQAADKKAIEMLRRSPYGDKLAAAGLFLRQMEERADVLPRLIRPHFGDKLASSGNVVRFSELLTQSPALEKKRLDQIAALPLGGRIYMDPWSGRIELAKSQPVPIVAVREKMPFEVTPFHPHLGYLDRSREALAARAAAPDNESK
jgi:hypothetical protein